MLRGVLLRVSTASVGRDEAGTRNVRCTAMLDGVLCVGFAWLAACASLVVYWLDRNSKGICMCGSVRCSTVEVEVSAGLWWDVWNFDGLRWTLSRA